MTKERLIELLDEIGATGYIDCGIDPKTGGRIESYVGSEEIAEFLISNGLEVSE